MPRTTLTTTDNLKLAAIWHLPSKPTHQAIILAHGLTVDKSESGLFTKLANQLAKLGLAVLRLDFRGHGQSEGRSIDFTITGQLLDLEAAHAEVKNQGYTQIGLLGASFGGGVSALYVAAHPTQFDCLCLWNPVLNYDHTFLHPTLSWLVNQKEHMQQELIDQGWTTIGSRKFVIGKKLFEDMASFQPHESLKQVKIPTLIIHGTNDDKVAYQDSKTYVSNLSHGKLITLDGVGHGFHGIGEAKKAINPTLDFFQEHLR